MRDLREEQFDQDEAEQKRLFRQREEDDETGVGKGRIESVGYDRSLPFVIPIYTWYKTQRSEGSYNASSILYNRARHGYLTLKTDPFKVDSSFILTGEFSMSVMHLRAC